jgi:hypothetical protein
MKSMQQVVTFFVVLSGGDGPKVSKKKLSTIRQLSAMALYTSTTTPFLQLGNPRRYEVANSIIPESATGIT